MIKPDDSKIGYGLIHLQSDKSARASYVNAL